MPVRPACERQLIAEVTFLAPYPPEGFYKAWATTGCVVQSQNGYPADIFFRIIHQIGFDRTILFFTNARTPPSTSKMRPECAHIGEFVTFTETILVRVRGQKFPFPAQERGWEAAAGRRQPP
jgi:hypothetical protein